METSLRIVLLLVAFFIILGIIWDAFVSRKPKNVKLNKKEPLVNNNKPKKFKKLSQKDPFSSDNPFENQWDDSDSNDPLASKESRNEDFDDVILVNSKENAVPNNRIQTSMNNNSKNNNIMILNLMARQPGVFGGKKLIDAFHEAHLYFGEMDIFHRYANTDGTGEIIFSVASAMEPGVFQISKMETFVTEGVTFFFVLEKQNKSIAAFELMLRTAKQLAMRLDGELKDEQQKFLTLQSIEKYRERTRQVEIKTA